MIQSHGNADLERGFSVNREYLVENQSEQFLIAQRQIYDALIVARGVQNITITKSLLHSARNAHSRYVESMEQRKKQLITEERTYVEKKTLALELAKLENEKCELIKQTKEKEVLFTEKNISFKSKL